MTTRVIIVLLALGLLAGCGRKGPPEPPPGSDERFPRAYPQVRQ